MLRLVLLVLATFFVWETVRFALEEYLPKVASTTRALHPLVLAAGPLALLWPDYVSALGVAGAAGLLVAVSDRVFRSSPPVTPVSLPRRRTPGGLPPLP